MFDRILSSSRFFKAFPVLIPVLILSQIAAAQFVGALPPIADPADKRFVGVKEDWTSPSLSSSNLRAVQPIRAYVNDHHGYTVELLRAQWRWGDPIDLYVMKPAGAKKPPVVLYLYGYPTDTDMFKDEEWQRAATGEGFAAVGFVSALTGHRYHDRPLKEWFLSELQESLATSAHDVQLVLSYLDGRGDLDMNQVGMFAQGSGASIAILASAADPRIKVLDVMDPWGDWPTWMENSPFVPKDERPNFVKPEFLKKAGVLDPVEWLPRIQAKKFQLEQNVYDKITPANAKEKLRAAVSNASSVVQYKTAKELEAATPNSTNVGWIERQLLALRDAPTRAGADLASAPPRASAGSSR
jgi:hypothetical protein